MTFQTMRLVVAAVGVAIWVYGYRLDSNQIRWTGIVILAVAVFLRFAAPRPPAGPGKTT